VASTTFDLSAANFALKELYDGQPVPNEVYEDNPLFAMVKKSTDFTGKFHPVPLIYGVSQGGSASFSIAQGGQTPIQGNEFLVTRKRNYDVVTIDNETMLAASGDKGAFIDGASVVIDGGMRNSVLNISKFCFGDGTGTRGAIATGGITSGVITLNDINTVAAFEVRYGVPVVWIEDETEAARQIEDWAWWSAREMVESVNNLKRRTK
jgi:hypothetical protein